MHKIYKYELPCKEKHIIQLPIGARIIRVEDIEGKFFLWAIVDTNVLSMEDRHLEFYKTGQPIETNVDDLKFLGTCKLHIMQELCLYVFENVGPPQPYKRFHDIGRANPHLTMPSIDDESYCKTCGKHVCICIPFGDEERQEF